MALRLTDLKGSKTTAGTVRQGDMVSTSPSHFPLNVPVWRGGTKKW